MKKVPIRITLVPKDQFKEVERLDRLATEIQKVSGFSLEELLSLFRSGYTLSPPHYKGVDELRDAAVETLESL